MWIKFKEWADEYAVNGFYRTEMLGAKFLVVSDEKVAEELFVKRAKFNSDRPAIRSLFDPKSTFGSMEYLPLMGKNDAANTQYRDLLCHKSKRWLARLIENPDDFASSLEDMASKITCQLTWDDPNVSEDLTKSAWKLLTQISPAGPITNILTPLWDLPWLLNPWKQAERRRHEELQAWWMERLITTRQGMEKGEQRPCYTKDFLEKGNKAYGISGDYEASSAFGMLALVGIFTVAGPLGFYLIAMVHHPDWQARVQREVDEVCNGRPPTLDDRANLPVLRACIKETMRWRPNVPTARILSSV
ncbi:cytochrome P450 2C30 [Diaporthe helianthi]|uniref:Cytochrome P450 2C30 n=1 Tax=Diaporthe helianthi TaxID=158607 RepID=A0A2P5HQC5_DIAHE|nr:cytochrome P450 2C30 [Diaporthe helianthi]